MRDFGMTDMIGVMNFDWRSMAMGEKYKEKMLNYLAKVLVNEVPCRFGLHSKIDKMLVNEVPCRSERCYEKFKTTIPYSMLDKVLVNEVPCRSGLHSKFTKLTNFEG